MDKVLKLENVDLYNNLYGLETPHPLVSPNEFKMLN